MAPKQMVDQTTIKSDGDVFHELFRYRPHQLTEISPNKILNCDLHDGDWGTVGSVIFWNYFHDGKERVAKEVIEAIDEIKRSVSFRVVEGDIMELYKTFLITVHVDTNGEDNVVTWTFDYEKISEDVEEPKTLMELAIALTKDIETHHILKGRMVGQTTIRSDGDVFHEIFRYRPHHISDMSPANIQNCDLHDGDWGTVGSVIFWNYFHDGKERVAKEVIEAIDEIKKSVSFRVVGGDLMELYKSFVLTVHVDTNGEDNLVTWTFDYEKINEHVEEPNTLMKFCLDVTKDIETHHIMKGKLVGQIGIKSGGDVFHEIFSNRPHHVSTMSPVKVQACNLHEGEFGKVGTIISWHYFEDGKDKVAKQEITTIDEEKKLITFKMLEGDLMEEYKTFLITIHVDTHGEDNLVTWTLEYEKLTEEVPAPNKLMDFFIQLTKDIEDHHAN